MVDSNNYWALFEKEGRGAPLSLSEGIMHTEFQKKNPFAPYLQIMETGGLLSMLL